MRRKVKLRNVRRGDVVTAHGETGMAVSDAEVMGSSAAVVYTEIPGHELYGDPDALVLVDRP